MKCRFNSIGSGKQPGPLHFQQVPRGFHDCSSRVLLWRSAPLNHPCWLRASCKLSCTEHPPCPRVMMREPTPPPVSMLSCGLTFPPWRRHFRVSSVRSVPLMYYPQWRGRGSRIYWNDVNIHLLPNLPWTQVILMPFLRGPGPSFSHSVGSCLGFSLDIWNVFAVLQAMTINQSYLILPSASDTHSR